MAFDAKLHTVDPLTGYHVHKEDGRRVGEPAPIKRMTDDTEYPKWLEPHQGHIKRHPIHGHISCPEWSDTDVNRNGVVKVLVRDEEEELHAMTDPSPPETKGKEEKSSPLPELASVVASDKRLSLPFGEKK